VASGCLAVGYQMASGWPEGGRKRPLSVKVLAIPSRWARPRAPDDPARFRSTWTLAPKPYFRLDSGRQLPGYLNTRWRPTSYPTPPWEKALPGPPGSGWIAL
jgi:hypothetical protein